METLLHGSEDALDDFASRTQALEDEFDRRRRDDDPPAGERGAETASADDGPVAPVAAGETAPENDGENGVRFLTGENDDRR